MQTTLGAAAPLGPAADSTLVLVHVDRFCCGNAAIPHGALAEYLASVLQLIAEAKQRRQAIVPAVLLRFSDSDKAAYAKLRDLPIPEAIKIPGVLHPVVAAALKGYPHCPEVPLQTRSDASPEVEQCCRQNGYPTASFDLAGMFAEYCVWSSAAGLNVRFPHSKVRVLTKACLPFNARTCWSIYEQPCSAGIELVPASPLSRGESK